jgi:hypothetical protein
MTMKELSLSQKVPFFGKRRLMRQTAEREADAARMETDDTANQVIRNVKAVYYDLSHIHRALEVTRRNKAILEDFSEIGPDPLQRRRGYPGRRHPGAGRNLAHDRRTADARSAPALAGARR